MMDLRGALGRRHVLFVDDEPAMHRLVARGLRDEDLRLTCVSDGAAALRVLERGSVDLLITALAMPVVDGVELLRHVANRGLVVPVIVATGCELPPQIDGSPLRFLREPLRIDDLVALVRERLGCTCAALTAVELAQLIALEGRSCALQVRSPGARGTLLFLNGVPVDASQAELRGEAAARELLSWPQAQLRIEAPVRGREFTMATGLGALLVEAAALREQRSDDAAISAAVDDLASGSTSANAAAPELAPWERPAASAPISALLAEALTIDGALGAALAVWELGECVAAAQAGEWRGAGGMQTAALGDARVLRATMTTMHRLGLDTAVHEVTITLDEQLHVLTPLPRHEGLFLHVVLERARSNLALARLRIRRLLDEFGLPA